MLPLILPPFKERFPGIDVEVTSGPGNRLIEGLRNGDTDFVFLPQWSKDKDIAQVKMTDEELVLVCARGYLPDECILDREKHIVNWRKAARLPFITLEKGHALRASVDVLAKMRASSWIFSWNPTATCSPAVWPQRGWGWRWFRRSPWSW